LTFIGARILAEQLNHTPAMKTGHQFYHVTFLAAASKTRRT